jgi:hypothetical protein
MNITYKKSLAGQSVLAIIVTLALLFSQASYAFAQGPRDGSGTTGVLAIAQQQGTNNLVSGPSVTPILVSNPRAFDCSELAMLYGQPGQHWEEYRIKEGDLVNGTKQFGNGLRVTINNLTSNKTFDWESNFGVDAVFVKSGVSGHNLYIYDPPQESFGDTNLSVPGNNEISYISFCYDLELQVSKTAVTSWTNTWTWGIEKKSNIDEENQPVQLLAGEVATVNYTVMVDATSMPSDFKVSGEVTIFNPAGVPATITHISDVLKLDGMDDIQVTVDCPTNTVAAGQTLTCTYEVDLDGPYSGTNEVTVVATGVEGGTATADVDFDLDKPTTVVDECIYVSDTNVNGPQNEEVCAEDLDSNGEYEFEYSVTFGYNTEESVDEDLVCGFQTYDNTASFTAKDTDQSGESMVAIDMNVLCALNISKTAETSWTLEWVWDILKSADPAGPVVLEEGEMATVDYTVTASANASTTFVVSGEVKVSNPTLEEVSVTGVSDALSESGAVALVCPTVTGFPYLLGAGESFTCTYEVVVDDPSTQENQAEVIVDSTVISGAVATTSVVFDTENPDSEINKCVTVSDTNANFGGDKTLCAGELINGEKVYTYSVTFGKDAGANVELECGFQTYKNTAKVSKGDVVLASSMVSIDMTVECALFCSLSQGYWFAKPGVDWGTGVSLGVHTYSRADGLNIWNIKGRNASRDAKHAFTQYAAIMLSLQAQELDKSDITDPKLLDALNYIETYFLTKSKLTSGNITKFPNDRKLRQASGFIGNWIDANHCDDEMMQ